MIPDLSLLPLPSISNPTKSFRRLPPSCTCSSTRSVTSDPATRLWSSAFFVLRFSGTCRSARPSNHLRRQVIDWTQRVQSVLSLPIFIVNSIYLERKLSLTNHWREPFATSQPCVVQSAHHCMGGPSTNQKAKTTTTTATTTTATTKTSNSPTRRSKRKSRSDESNADERGSMWTSKGSKKKKSTSGINESAIEKLFQEIADDDDPNVASMEGKRRISIERMMHAYRLHHWTNHLCFLPLLARD